jgi:hypothetical protein
MTRKTKTRMGNFYTRAQTANMLTAALGDGYDWHKHLTCTTERTRDYLGFKRSGLQLPPACLLGQQPYYEEREIKAHIAALRAAFPYLRPSSSKPKELAVPVIDFRRALGIQGFRINKAMLI